MEMMIGGLMALFGAGFFIGLFTLVRIHQFSKRYRLLDYLDEKKTPSVIVLLDFYRGSHEFRERLLKTCELYQQLKNERRPPIVLLTAGQLNGEVRPIAASNAEALIELGIPRSNVVIYLGNRLKGAADTYEEVLLACEWLRSHGASTAYVVTNLSQAFHAHYIGIFQRVLFRPVIIHPANLFEPQKSYQVGKLFQAMLLLLDPTGRNPLSVFMRLRRRYFSNSV